MSIKRRKKDRASPAEMGCRRLRRASGADKGGGAGVPSAMGAVAALAWVDIPRAGTAGTVQREAKACGRPGVRGWRSRERGRRR